MRKYKSGFMVMLAFVMILILSSCSNSAYEGKEISSIEYISIKYNGGYVSETKIDFVNGQVFSRGYFPTDNITTEYTLDDDFEMSSISLFLKEASKSGLFDLEENYPSPGGILDGAGWTLKIYYIDGTSKTSTGDNNFPNTIFEKADLAFYHLYGDDLFNTMPSS